MRLSPLTQGRRLSEFGQAPLGLGHAQQTSILLRMATFLGRRPNVVFSGSENLVALDASDGTADGAIELDNLDAVLQVGEGETFIIDLSVTDDASSEGAGLTYSLSGGADQGLFSLDASTGALSFTSTPDFEAPADAGADNVYDVEVTVTDAGGLSDNQAFKVLVTDIDIL